MAKIKSLGKSNYINVIFKNDMMIEISGSTKLSGCEAAYLFFAILFMLICYGAIGPTILLNGNYLLVLIISWIIYQIMGCYNSNTRYIQE